MSAIKRLNIYKQYWFKRLIIHINNKILIDFTTRLIGLLNIKNMLHNPLKQRVDDKTLPPTIKFKLIKICCPYPN